MPLSLQSSFYEFCNKNKFEINKKQTEILNSLENFIFPRNKFLNFFSKKEDLSCFYLYGNVGVGKTMIANFVYEQINIKKTKFHFSEFMINFHDFRHKKKDGNSISKFVKSSGLIIFNKTV